MGVIILKSILYFLPGYMANAVPVILCRFKLFEFMNVRCDFGYELGGEDLLGKTKTIRGIVGGAIGGVITAVCCFYLLNMPELKFLSVYDGNVYNFMIIGFLMGLGEGLGDLIKSFFKRRLHIKSSAPFFPFDQTSFLGALFLSFLVFVPPVEVILTIVILSPTIPVIANIVAYKMGWKKVWW